MKLTKSWLGLALLAAASGCATAAHHPAAADAARINQAGEMDEAAMMQAYMEAGAPGPEHAALAEMVGRWRMEATGSFDPSSPPETSHGSSNFEMVLDGRYLVERSTGSWPSMGPFEGMGITAYNKVTKKYENLWMDNMGTGFMLSQGTPDASGAVNYVGSYDDPFQGRVEIRGQWRKIDSNKFVYEMWSREPAGERKVLEVRYSRGG